MSRNSKAKGGKYERELVVMLQDEALAAYKVPLSGALGGAFSEDVVLADEYRIEVKYRRNADSFASLYKWIEGADVLEIPCSTIYTWDAFIAWVFSELDGTPLPELKTTTKTVTKRTTLHGWKGRADILALRKAGHRTKPAKECWLFLMER